MERNGRAVDLRIVRASECQKLGGKKVTWRDIPETARLDNRLESACRACISIGRLRTMRTPHN